MMSERPLTSAEARIAPLVTLLAVLISVSYIWGRIATLSPGALLGFTIATVIVLSLWLSRRATSDPGPLAAALGLTAIVLLWLVRLTPAELPAGGGPDLTHHLQLIDYLERHWRLPDASLAAVMNEMAHYTPGVHLVAALAGAWARIDGFHAISAILALSVALKCALVFLIALRVMPSHPARIPIAFAAVVLAVSAQSYFLGSFVRDSFWAQVFAELFAVAMWWALVVWDEHRPAANAVEGPAPSAVEGPAPSAVEGPAPSAVEGSRVAMMLFGAAGAGAFLTWPVWIGPPIVALVAAVLVRGDIPFKARVRDLAIALAPIAFVAVVHALGRAGWLGMAGTTGAVLRPSLAAIGWPLAVLGGAGFLLALFRRPARATVLFVISIAVQAATLYAVAQSAGASTPYMAFKMFYLLIYPLAVLGASALAVAFGRLGRARLKPGAAQWVAWGVLLIVLVAYRRPLFEIRIPAPIVSEDLYAAGQWTRAQIEAACVDYLVPNADTAYWLHLAVLGNPRQTPRTANPDTFDPKRSIARWIEPSGLPYAIVDLSTLPKEVLNDVDVLEQFGTAAVVKRRGPSFCADAQRFAVATD